jgi:tRNA A-37 threonylcarbamoyl transferase component Bud32/predicted RNA-binding Zn-ribbon protein involved in translation (DUF1610 family)
MAVDNDFRIIRNRYWIVSKLASGGMGDTYRVWDALQRVPAVIKMPRRGAKGAEDNLRRFIQELHAMLALKHEHIVPITDYGDDEELPFVVMRFLPGGSLADYLKDGSGGRRINSVSMLHCWLPGIAAALDFMHESSVLHRDVKPANIFLDAFLKPYLGDFGIAKAFDDSSRMLRGEDLTADHMAIGTAAYMSPEQFRRGGRITPATDQYSLAVTVYEMISGSKPFRGDVEHIGVEHCTIPPPPLDVARLQIPPSVWVAVERALAKQPEQRFASCAEFARSALAEVAPLRVDARVARFLCPGCKTIIRLEVSRAGTAGMCKKCRTVLEVAKDVSALWLRDEQVIAGSKSRGAAAGEGSLNDAGRAWQSLMRGLRQAAARRLGWLLSTGGTAALAAACGGAAAWVANEAHWRNRFASDIFDSRVELERANSTIETLQRQLQDARKKAAVLPGDAATPGPSPSSSPSGPRPGNPGPIVIDEDDRGLPTAR